jgi:chromosome partitioning protein
LPIQPQLYDIETLTGLKDVLALAGHPPCAVVVNRAPVQGKRHLETQEAARAQGFTVSSVVMCNRAAHGDACNLGRSAAELQPDSRAAEEVTALYSYIVTALQEAKA